MEKGQILKEKYRVEKKLGSGGMSEVWLCTNIELGNKWAVKHIRGSEELSDAIYAETEILKKLNHMNLPKIADIFKDETGTYIVESYVEGTPLNRLLEKAGSFAEERVAEWAWQLCEALAYLHNLKPNPIIYRDMKPSNIIITPDNRAVLIDFGISREYKRTKKTDTFVAGTSYYAAPEQLIAGGYTDRRTDIYSLGVTMYQLLTGKLPEYNAVGLGRLKRSISPEMEAIVHKCLEKRLEDRYQNTSELISDLDSLKSVYILRETGKALLKKLAIAAIVILSIITYTVVFLGLYDLHKQSHTQENGKVSVEAAGRHYHKKAEAMQLILSFKAEGSGIYIYRTQ